MSRGKQHKHHGRHSRGKYDEVSPAEVDVVTHIPLTEEQQKMLAETSPVIRKFNRKVELAELLQEVDKERGK